jgi:aminobenzoyl-glutamate transport protein
MSMSSIPSHSPSGKLYGWVERIGNKVPHPFLLFIYLIVILMVATAVLSAFDVSVRSPADGSLVAVKNLLSVDGLHWFLPNVIKNFSGFAPLGAILALVLGAGLAERVGLLPALMVKMASHVSALRQLYGAVYRLLQPYLLRRRAGDHAADGGADLPRRRAPSRGGPAVRDCGVGCGLPLTC